MVRWLIALFGTLFVLGCSGDDKGGVEGLEGQVRLAVTSAPSDVSCLRVSITSSRSSTRLLDLTPGQTSVFLLTGLATGQNTFDEDAFAESCDAVTDTSVPNWVGDPVTAYIQSGIVADVRITLRRNGQANVTTDFEEDPPSGCGQIGSPCTVSSDCCSGRQCVSGVCEPSCAPGLVECVEPDGLLLCVDVLSDPSNCGACDVACPAGTSCTNGVCAPPTCSAPRLECPAPDGTLVCTDPTSDPNNCGACGRVCPSGTSCTPNGCLTTCPAPFVQCTGPNGQLLCVDTASDPNNCGGCNLVCPADMACTAGACTSTCSAPSIQCRAADGSLVCTDLTSDPLNCGACGRVCPSGTSCTPNGCLTTCSAPFVQCTGPNGQLLCVDTSSDPNNCGACGLVCAEGNTCSAGVCTGTPRIAPDQSVVDFGSVAVGARVLGTLTGRNAGSADLIISQAQITGGSSPADFMIARPVSNLLVPPGGTFQVAMEFGPTAPGARDAILTLFSNDPLSPSTRITLVGEGASPAIAVNPRDIRFAATPVGSRTPSQTVTIQNTGTVGASLTVSQIALSQGAGDFFLSTGALPMVISPGSSSGFSVQFMPAAVGTRTGQVVIQSDDPLSPTVFVTLSGDGI